MSFASLGSREKVIGPEPWRVKQRVVLGRADPTEFYHLGDVFRRHWLF